MREPFLRHADEGGIKAQFALLGVVAHEAAGDLDVLDLDGVGERRLEHGTGLGVGQLGAHDHGVQHVDGGDEHLLDALVVGDGVRGQLVHAAVAALVADVMLVALANFLRLDVQNFLSLHNLRFG